MASAQVLPSSRKQELAEAGRRKLEQFRKAKAAKKASANSRSQPVDSTTGYLRVTESDGAVTSKSNGHVGVVTDNNIGNEFSQESLQVSSIESHSNSQFSGNEYNTSSKVQEIQKDDAFGSVGAVDFYNIVERKESNNDSTVHSRPQGILFSSINKQASQNYDYSCTKSSFHGVQDSLFSIDRLSKGKPQTSGSTLLPSMPSVAGSPGHGHEVTPSYEESLKPTSRLTESVLEAGKNQQGSVEFKGIKISDPEGQMPSTSTSSLFTLQDIPMQSSESSVFGSDFRSSTPLYPATTETNARRSRPSFLDSLNITRASSETNYPPSEIEKSSITSCGSKLDGADDLGSSTFQNSSASFGPFSTFGLSNASNSFEHSVKSLVSVSNGATLGFNDFPPPKQNEDFAALEQHIEDLTQEKFSLQRALEASRALAESLASENSSLTDNYNQQRSIVDQLKADMEKLQEETQAQRVDLESFRNEYANARLECNAADERSKILASEVIGSEEKALRLRSNELKLERELENSQAELSSYKKKMSSLEKECQDLQSTVSAQQEEKKILQTKLRKASAGGKSIDLSNIPTSRNDMSTSTEDLEADSIPESSNQDMHNSALFESGTSNFTMLPENGQSAHELLSVIIPADQMRMIQNIDTLISELALEKEELVQALSSELSQSAKLEELNKELSRKLEAQTQRLELLTAQNMAGDSISSTRQPESHVVQGITPYVDEGDEVVERVLGWIMKLFPGGPSRRRTSKLL